MAKVTAPLFSFGARGQIAKALVYFPWKGINAVRRHVVPANPRSDLQTDQREYLEEAVDEWHLAKYTASDRAAWNRYAATLAKPMSGFNAFIKMSIAILRNALAIYNPPFNALMLDGGAGVLDMWLDEDGDATSCYLRWGYKKTDMNTQVAMVEAPADTWCASGVAATVGQTVYGRVLTNSGDQVQGWSGIFQLLIT